MHVMCRMTRGSQTPHDTLSLSDYNIAVRSGGGGRRMVGRKEIARRKPASRCAFARDACGRHTPCES